MICIADLFRKEMLFISTLKFFFSCGDYKYPLNDKVFIGGI